MEKQKQIIERKIAQLWRPGMDEMDIILELTAFCQQQDLEYNSSEIKAIVADTTRILKAKMA